MKRDLSHLEQRVIEVVLRPDEFAAALDVATRRISDSLLNKSRDGLSNKNWITGTMKHIQGACAEIAVAKALDKYPQFGVRQFTGMVPDVSSNLEVRYSTSGRLVVRHADPSDRIYILVTGDPPCLTINGWATKDQVQSAGSYEDPGGLGKPAWFLDKDLLNSIESLKGQDEL